MLSRAESLEILKVIGVRFGGAARVQNFYAGNSQPQQRKTHRHAMVIVGMNLGRLRHSGKDREALRMFFRTDTGAFEFRHDGCDAAA